MDIRPRSAFPLDSPYPSTGHSSVGRVVRPYEPPALLTCLRLTRAFSLSTSRACHKVHVEDGTHRVDISPTSGSLTLHPPSVQTQQRIGIYDNIMKRPSSHVTTLN